MIHDYHDALPGYDPRQILYDGCAECEERGRNVEQAIFRLDSERFRMAWLRAYNWQSSRGDKKAVGPVSAAEAPLLSVLWAIQMQLQRLDIQELFNEPC